MIGGRVRSGLKALAAVEDQPVVVLRHLNNLLLEEDVSAFVTLVVGSARPAEDGGLDIVVAGGGHLAPLVLRGNGQVREVTIGGALVGALSGVDFEQAAFRLAAGDSLLLYSDGITEARGGPIGQEMYGEQRLARDLATCAQMPAEAVAERIDLLLGRWLAGRPHDDLALLVLQAPTPLREERTGAGIRGLAA